MRRERRRLILIFLLIVPSAVTLFYWKGFSTDIGRTLKSFATPLLSADLDEAAKSLDTIRNLYFQEVLRVHVNCRSVQRIGRKGDGGWDACLDDGFSPRPPCLVYSFGVGNIWEFDEQLSKDYKCTVRAFDPTMAMSEHVHKPGKVLFYPIGIGGAPKGKKNNTFITNNLKTFLQRFKETDKVIDILKLDVEYSEWEALESIIEDNLLGQVKQLLVEYHTNELNHIVTTAQVYRRYLSIMKGLELEGFRKFKATKSDCCIDLFWNTLRKANASMPPKRPGKLALSACYVQNYINTRYLTE